MAPTPVFCPNPVCPARGLVSQGNISIHSRSERRFICTQCHKTFAATKGTIFSRLRTSTELGVTVVTWLAHGCPVQALVAAFGCDERTVAAWAARAGRQGQAVQEHLVEPPRDLGHVPAEEIRVKTQGGIVWMALSLMGKTRLWLAGEVRVHRAMMLIRGLLERVPRCALHRPILFGTDGLSSAIRAMRATCRNPVQTGGPGYPRWYRGATSASHRL
jgi:transposase-like protein